MILSMGADLGICYGQLLAATCRAVSSSRVIRGDGLAKLRLRADLKVGTTGELT
jgi:hypothetical protein